MSKQMNIEELKALIANGIREQNLHEALPEGAVEIIKEKILSMRDREYAQQIPEVVSEAGVGIATPNYGTDQENVMPDERELTPSPEQQMNMSGSTQPEVDVAPGSISIDTTIEPVMGYTPELPEMLQKAAPAELFVFQYNDIGVSGENLSYKPMRLMDDPDVKQSMQDLWIKEGKTKAKVYVAKFEEIGEIDFNYADGTSKFTEKASLPDYAGGPGYKENPYAAESMPQIDTTTQSELETYIKSSIDLEKVVNDIVMGIVRDSLLTNTEQAANVNEDIYDSGENRENNGYSVAQAVKPMEESSLKMTMEDIVKDDEYEKIILPNGLCENVNSGNKSMLVLENEEIQLWEFEGKEYYLPVGRISKNKGYIKL